MNLDLLVFFSFYFLAIFSVIGYGLFFANLTNFKSISQNQGFLGLVGLFFLTIYSYLSNFFYSHGLVHNSILLFVGLFLYFYLLDNKKKKDKNQTSITIIIFLILFIAILIFKTHDDFPYYHFAYSYYLTQSSSFIGIGAFNHGFRTPSSIFYMNSLFYLPILKFYLFHIPALMIMGFVNIILIKNILNNLDKASVNFITFFSLFSFLFINIFFYRVGEHGTDRSSQILVFILLIEILLLINFKYEFDDKLSKIFVLLGLIISLKAFYILYILFLIPVVLKFIKVKNNFNFLSIIKNKFCIFFILITCLMLLTNFFNTGCFIYPISASCLPNLSWSFDIQLVNQMNDWYEQWSKAGAGPNFRVDNPQEYIKFLNWVPNWIDVYFFNKVSDFVLGVLFTVLIVFFTFNSKVQNKIEPRNISLIYLTMIILFFEWFYNHPALRYGGYCIISSLIFLPIAQILEKKVNLKNKNLSMKFKILVISGFLIFFGRNLDRINNEKEIYGYNFLVQPYYSFNDQFFSIQNEFARLIKNFEECKKNVDNNCSKDLEPKVIKSFGKYIFINNR